MNNIIANNGHMAGRHSSLTSHSRCRRRTRFTLKNMTQRVIQRDRSQNTNITAILVH
jgi:hypothetical protein